MYEPVNKNSFNQIGQQEGNKTQKSQKAYPNKSFSVNIWKLEKKLDPRN